MKTKTILVIQIINVIVQLLNLIFLSETNPELSIALAIISYFVSLYNIGIVACAITTALSAFAVVACAVVATALSAFVVADFAGVFAVTVAATALSALSAFVVALISGEENE